MVLFDVNCDNFKKLMSASSAESAVKTAKKDMCQHAISHQGQVCNGWGGLEHFLLRLCSMFSSRCASVCEAIVKVQNIQEEIERSSVDVGTNGIAKGMLRLYQTSMLYNTLGATMSFRVETTGTDTTDTDAKLIIRGQLQDDSEFTENELTISLTVSSWDATVFKVLGGDLIERDSDNYDPYVNTLDVKRCLESCDLAKLSDNQSALLKELVKWKENDIHTVMKAINQANKAKEVVLQHIEKNKVFYNDDDNKLANFSWFHDIYEKDGRTVYNLNDFVQISPQLFSAKEKVFRNAAVDRMEKELGRYQSIADNQIRDIEQKTECFFQKNALTLRNTVSQFVFAVLTNNENNYCNIALPETTEMPLSGKCYNKDKFERMLNSISDQRFSKLARECIEKCNQCEDTPDESHYNEAASATGKLLKFYAKRLKEEADKTEAKVHKTERKLDSTLLKLQEGLEKTQAEYNKLTREIAKATQNKENLLQERQQVLSDISAREEQQQEIQGGIDTLTSEKEESQAQLAELDKKLQEQQTDLKSLEAYKQGQETEWCERFSAVANEMRQNLESVNHLRNMYQDLNDSNNFRLADNRLEDFKKNTLHLLTDDYSRLSFAELNQLNEYRNSCMEELARKFNEYLPGRFALNDIPPILEAITVPVGGDDIFFVRTRNRKSFLNTVVKPDLSRLEKWMGPQLPKAAKHDEKASELNKSKIISVHSTIASYVKANNVYLATQYNQKTQAKERESIARKLCGTVYSLINDSVEWQEEIQRSSDKLKAGIDISAYPESVREQAKKFNSEARTIFNDLAGEQEVFHKRITRLQTTLSHLFGGHNEKGILQYAFFDKKEPLARIELNDQEREDIQWLIDFISANNIVTIDEHHTYNQDSISGWHSALNNAIQKGGELNNKLNELAEEFSQRLVDVDSKIKSAAQLIEETTSYQKEVSDKIQAQNDGIAHLEKQHTENNKEIKKLSDSNKSLDDKIAKAEGKILKDKEKLAESNSKIAEIRTELASTKANGSEKISELQSKCDYIKNIAPSFQKHTEKYESAIKKIKSKREEMSQAVKADVEYLKNYQEALDVPLELLNVNGCNILGDWVNMKGRPGQSVAEENFSYILNSSIPRDVTGEQIVELWANSAYDAFNYDGLKKAYAAPEAAPLRNLSHVNGTEEILNKIQTEKFESLFNITGVTLVTEVKDSFKKYCSSHNKDEKDFKSFQEYIGSLYGVIKSFNNTLSNASRKSLMSKEVYEDAFSSIEKTKIILGKAQVLYGIYILTVRSDTKIQELARDMRLGDIASINADMRGRMLAQLLNGSSVIKDQFSVDGKASEDFVKEWGEANGYTNDKEQGLLSKVIDFFSNSSGNNKVDYTPAIRFLVMLRNSQFFPVLTAMKTGRIITSQSPVEFAAPTLQASYMAPVNKELKGVNYLLNLTDIAGGACIRAGKGKNVVNDKYQWFIDDREDLLLSYDGAEVNAQVSQICNKLDVRVLGLPEMEPAVA